MGLKNVFKPVCTPKENDFELSFYVLLYIVRKFC